MQQYFQHHWEKFLLTLILLVFIGLKYEAMHIPYFWDELGVYAPGANYMFENGPGLLPSALDPEYSHGHPLLFYFLNALAFSVLGNTVFAGHIVPMLGAIALIITLYFFAAKHTDKRFAFLVILVLIAQPLFYAQSAMMLPEIFVALFFLISLSNYMQGKMFMYAIAGACAILTKETGVVIPFIVFCSEIVIAVRRKSWKGFGKKLLVIFIPVFIFIVFISIQKIQNGWFFFPYHIGLIKITFTDLTLSLKAYLRFLFFEQGRWLFSAFIITAFIFSAFKKFRNYRYSDLHVYLFFWLTGGLLFCALNFYMSRYVMFLIPPFILLFYFSLRVLTARKIALISITAVCITVALMHMRHSTFRVDTDLGYVDYVSLQKEAMDYTMQKIGEGEMIFSNFPIHYAFLYKYAGYVDKETKNFRLTTTGENAHWVLMASHGPWLPEFDALETFITDTIFRNRVEEIVILKNIDPNETQ